MKNTENTSVLITTQLQNNEQKEPEFHLYKKRWLVIGIYLCFSFSNSFQWSQYIIINNVVIKYYQVPNYAVDWTIIVYMIAVVPLLLPALCLLNKVGIRYCMLLSSFGLCVGAWVKVYASMERDRFSYVIIGQIFEAVFQVLIFGLATRVAAVWFGAKEVAFAYALASVGDQFGVATGFYFPSKFVKNTTIEEIGSQLLKLNLMISSGTTAIFLAILIFFSEKPKTPPSSAQMLQDVSKSNTFQEMRGLIKRKSFILLIISYGINISSRNTFLMLFNEQFLQYFPNNEERVGTIAFLLMLAGIVGSILFGYFLGRFPYFKETSVCIYGGVFLALLMYIFMLRSQNLVLVYVAVILIGFFQNSYYSVAVQLAVELTYPVSECISASILFLTLNMFGFLISNLSRWMYNSHGDLWANCALASLLLFGTILSVIIPSKLRRQNANKNRKCLAH